MVKNKMKKSKKPLAAVGLTLTLGGVVVPLVNGVSEVSAVSAVPTRGNFYRGYRAFSDKNKMGISDSHEGWSVLGSAKNGGLKYANLLIKEPRDLSASDWDKLSYNGGDPVGGVQLRQIINALDTKITVDSAGKPYLHIEGDAVLNKLFHMTEQNHKVAIMTRSNSTSEIKVHPVTLTPNASTALHDFDYYNNGKYQEPLPAYYNPGWGSNKNTIPNSTNGYSFPNERKYPYGFESYFQDEYSASYRGGIVQEGNNFRVGPITPGQSIVPGQVAKVCGLGIVSANNASIDNNSNSCNYLYDYSGYSVDIPLGEIVSDLTKAEDFEVRLAISMATPEGSQVVTDRINYVGNPIETTVALPNGVTSQGQEQTVKGTFTFKAGNLNEKYGVNPNFLYFRQLTKETPLPSTIWSGSKINIPSSIMASTGVAAPKGTEFTIPENPEDNPNIIKWVSGKYGRNMMYLGSWDSESGLSHLAPILFNVPRANYNTNYTYFPVSGLQKTTTGVIKYTPNPDAKVSVNITHASVPNSNGAYDFSNTSVLENENLVFNSSEKSVFAKQKGPFPGNNSYIRYARINGGKVISTSADGHWIDFSKYVDTKKGGTINVELFYAEPSVPDTDYIPCQGKACGEIKLESYHNMYLKKFNTDASSGEKPKLVNHYTPMVEVEGDHIFMVDNIKSEITTVSDGNKKYSHSTTDTAYVNNDAINKFVNDKANEVPRYKNIANNLEYPTLVNPAEKVAHKGIVESIRDKYSNIKDVSELNQNKYEEEILSKNKLNSLYKTWLDADSADLRKWNDDNTVSTVWDENFDKEYLDVAYRTDVDYHTDLKVNYVNKGAIRYHYVDVPHHYIDSNGEEQTKWVSTRETYWDPEAYQEYDNTELIGTKHFSKEYEVKGKNPFNVGRTFGNLDKNVESGYSKALVGFESMLDGEKYRAGSTLRKVYEQFGYTDGSVDGEIPTQQAIPIGGKMMYMNPFDVSDMPYKEKANKAHSGIPHMMTSSEVDKVISENNGVFHSDMYYNKNKAKVYFDNVDEEDKAVFSEYRVGNPAATKGDVNKLAMNPLRIPSGVEVSAHSLMSPTGLNYTYSLPVRYSYDLHELKLDGVMAVGQDTGVPAFGNKQDVTAKYKAYYPTRKGNTTKAKAPDELVTVNNGSVLFTPLDTNIGDTIRTRMVVGGVGLSDLTFIDDTYNKVASYLYGRGENTTFSSERSNIEHEDGGIHTGASTLIKSEDLQGSPDVYKVNGVRVGNGPEFNKQVLGGK